MRLLKILLGVFASVIVVQILVLLIGSKMDPIALGALPMTILFFGVLAAFYALVIVGVTGLVLRWMGKARFLPVALIVLGGAVFGVSYLGAEDVSGDSRVVSAMAWMNCGLALLLWGILALGTGLTRAKN